VLDVYEFRIGFKSRNVWARITLHFTSDLTNDPKPILTAGILWFAYVNQMWAHVREAQGQFVRHDVARIRRINNGGGPWYVIHPELTLNPLVPIPLPFDTAAVVLLSGKLGPHWVNIPIRFPGIFMENQNFNRVPPLQYPRIALAFSHLFHDWNFLGRTFRGCIWSRRHQVFDRPRSLFVKPTVTCCPLRRPKF